MGNGYRDRLEHQYESAVSEFEQRKAAAIKAIEDMNITDAYEKDAARILNVAGINASAVRAGAIMDMIRQYDICMRG